MPTQDLVPSAPMADRGAASSRDPGLESRDVFVARQPIFDRRKKVYGYELLFRSGIENACPPTDGTEASRHVLHVAWLDLGLATLTGSKLAFVNFTQDLIASGFVASLPPESLVVELLESIEPTDDVVRACRDLKQHGFILALDDFIYRPGLEPLIALADIVKIGFGECDPAEQCAQVRRLAPQGPKLLAEKVETAEDVEQAEALGFDYFQGYFFCRPEIVQGRALTGSRVTCLKLLQAVSRAELQLGEIERVIESDVSLTHRFVKYLGSAAFPWRAPITSVHQALVLLGEAQTRRWVTLISLGEMATGKPAELLVNSAVRAKCCDELAGEVGMADRKAALFLMGAFFLIDTMLDQPMADVLAQLRWRRPEDGVGRAPHRAAPGARLRRGVRARRVGHLSDPGRRAGARGRDGHDDLPGCGGLGHGVVWGGVVNRDVLQRVLQSPRLPSLPAVALEVLALAQTPDVNIQQIAHTIQHDPALSSKILRTVNSSFYGYPQSIGTISHALVVLGLNAMKSLVLGFSLIRDLKASRGQGLDHVGYWRRSLYTATAAKTLGDQAGWPAPTTRRLRLMNARPWEPTTRRSVRPCCIHVAARGVVGLQ